MGKKILNFDYQFKKEKKFIIYFSNN